MKENCLFQYEHCPEYRSILDGAHFDPHSIKTMTDLAKLPFLPTLYFKHHELRSVPQRKMIVSVTSSGTSSGVKSKIGYDLPSLWRGWNMVKRVFRYHRLWSWRLTHFIIFGYEPKRSNHAAISKTAYGFTWTAPSLSKDYAIRYLDGAYHVDLANIEQRLLKYAKGHHPVRTLGFPAYTYFLLKQMKEEGFHLTLPKGSKITLGGGWKQFYAEKVEKKAFYALVKDVLGLDERNVVEFFGAVEHPILWTDCREHHFHVPCYARVIIRDPDTLEPLPNGGIGVINLLTPMVGSAPLLSVMTDDLGILHEKNCPCGVNSPYLEIIGRVGIADIKTCAAGADDLLKGGQK